MPLRRALAAVGVLLFLVGWLVTLIGVSLLQSKCNDAGFFYNTGTDSNSFLAPTRGDGCRRLFRFPWFVIALCLIPVIFSVLSIIKPHAGASSSAALWAVIAGLSILMTNFFYNLHDLAGENQRAALVLSDDNDDGLTENSTLVLDIYEVYEERVKVALAGFALMSAGALLNILLQSFLSSKAHDHENHGGVVEHTHTEHKVIGVHNVNPINTAVPVRFEEAHTVGTVGVRPTHGTTAVNTATMREVHVV